MLLEKWDSFQPIESHLPQKDLAVPRTLGRRCHFCVILSVLGRFALSLGFCFSLGLTPLSLRGLGPVRAGAILRFVLDLFRQERPESDRLIDVR